MVKIAGIEVATFFIPGGAAIKAIRIVGFVSQMAIFSGFDEWIRGPILFAYKNSWDLGPDLKKSEQVLISDLLRMKEDRWMPSMEKDELDVQIVLLGKLNSQWRQTNLQTVLEAQSNWEQKIGQLSLTYRGSKIFYSKADLLRFIESNKGN